MMSFALEAWATELPDMLGPKIKEYVRRIHDRYVPLGRSCCTLTDVFAFLPQTSVSAREFPRRVRAVSAIDAFCYRH